jgi:hypothetical protein
MKLITDVQSCEYANLQDKLLRVLRGQLKHGFGEITIECEVGKGKDRHVILKHGHSEKFVISLDEIASLEC